jgi:predicted nucleic acid-binding protein
MNGYLLDTNVISEYSRPWPPNPQVKMWVDAQNEDTLHLSVWTLGEIRKGATLLPASKKRDQLENWLQADLPARFANRILPINGEIAELWGAMAGQSQLKGVALAIIDGLMAATAKHHDLTMVTRDLKDFARVGVPVVNPWEPMSGAS